MLKVTFEIVPYGIEDHENRREIGTLEIGLLRIFDGNYGEYKSTMTTDGFTEPANPEVFINTHDRDKGAFELVQRCLDAHASKLYEAPEIPDVSEDEGPVCAACGNTQDLMGVEYDYTSPHRYDGVSEWRCQCGARTGRWSGKVLEDGVAEPRWGITK